MSGLLLLLLATFPGPLLQKGTAVDSDALYDHYQGAQSYAQILGRQAELEWMALPPQAGEGTAFFGGQVEAGVVLAAGVGPGFLGSIWADSQATGELEVYVDGADRPVLIIGWTDFLNGPLSQKNRDGRRCTLPLPFAKSLEVKSTEGGFSYQMEVTHLGEGRSVESIHMEMLSANAAKIQATDALLKANAHPAGMRVVKGWGAASTLSAYDYTIVGNGVVVWFELKFMNSIPADQRERVLREMRIVLSQGTSKEGGRLNPDVLLDVPFGDFFGSGPGLSPHSNRALGVTSEGGFFCRLPLPYQDGFMLSVQTDGEEAHRFSLEMGFRQIMTPPTLRLHAAYLQKDDVKAQGGVLRFDKIKGPGRLAGVSLSALNPMKPWWGKGPTSISADNNHAAPLGSYPGAGAFFHAPVRADGPFSFGWHHLNRFFSSASVAFHQELSVEHQLQHPEEALLHTNSLLWWYSAGDAWEPSAVPALADRIPAPLPTPDFPVGQRIVEAEEMEVVRVTAGQASAERGDGQLGLSQDSVLTWRGIEAGKMMILSFPMAAAAQGEMKLQFITGPDAADVRVYLNGRPAGEKISLKTAELGVKTVSVGVQNLAARAHRLTFKAESPGQMSLDFLILE